MRWPDWPADLPAARLRAAAGAQGVTQARLAWEALLRSNPLSHPLAPRTAYRVETVLEELLMNVALHGHTDGRLHEVDIAMALAPDAVLLALQDDGRAFDPTAVTPPAPAAALADAPIGGRGLGLVRRAVRDWHYERAGGLNRQRLAVALA